MKKRKMWRGVGRMRDDEKSHQRDIIQVDFNIGNSKEISSRSESANEITNSIFHDN